MNGGMIAVFGGTGFLGRRVVRHLLDHGFAVRVVSRHADRAREMFGADSRIEPVRADIRDAASIPAAVDGAAGVVNAVSLYVERGRATFHAIHVEAAARLARAAAAAGVGGFAHVSGIGSDPSSPSLYARKRGEGEVAVRDTFPRAVIIRPAVMVGPGDAFLSAIMSLVRRLPVIPLFGGGRTRLQPAFVEDVGEAIARALERDDVTSASFELGGAQVHSYRELVERVAAMLNRRPLLVPVPFTAWHALAWLAERLPRAPITTNQVALMRTDNVASPGAQGFAELGIAPRSVDSVLPIMM